MIKVRNISKSYQLGHIVSHKTLGNAFLNLFRQQAGEQRADTFWALQDISFDVRQGEVVGLIGKNGTGKSTLLKILSRITGPTSGCIELNGRVASLLEVGTGFNPELTGRENIFLNGAILGMSRHEIQSRFDEIVAFAEVEKFLDTPVKRYSSGMYVRLAFAVAAHLEPEILLIDEVLAVGDFEFQAKCLGKMNDAAKDGRTVLFVSHNMAAVKQLCQRALVLSEGRIAADLPAEEAVAHYLGMSRVKDSIARKVWGERAGKGPLMADYLEIRNRKGEATSNYSFDEDIFLELSVTVFEEVIFQVSYTVVNSEEVWVFSTEAGIDPNTYRTGSYIFRTTIPGNFLAPGDYHIYMAIHYPNRKIYFEDQKAIAWSILDTGSAMSRYQPGVKHGVVMKELNWDIDQRRQ